MGGGGSCPHWQAGISQEILRLTRGLPLQCQVALVLVLLKGIAVTIGAAIDIVIVSWALVRKPSGLLQRCKMQQMRQIYMCYFFSAGANFWAILGHFWAILAILGNFWAILSHFGSFLGHFLVLIFCGKICICSIEIAFCNSGMDGQIKNFTCRFMCGYEFGQ